MKLRMYALAACLIVPLTLGGCAVKQPTYAEVRAETLDVLAQVAAFIPDPIDVVPTPEFDPYPCGDSLTTGHAEDSFYTGQWAVFVEEDFDVHAFVATVPARLGPDWRAEDTGISTSFAQVYLVRDSPRTTITVEESRIDGRKAVDLLAISRCGTAPD